MSNILVISISLCAYIIIGIIISIVEWNIFVKEELSYYKEQRDKFKEELGVTEEQIPQYLLGNWQTIINNNDRLLNCPPQFSNYGFLLLAFTVLWLPALAAMTLYSLYKVVVLSVKSKKNAELTKIIEEDRRPAIK